MDRGNLEEALDILTASERLELSAARRQVVEDAKAWTTAPSVEGFGIGERTTKADADDELVLKVYVEKELPPDQLQVPSEIVIPEIDGPVPVEIEEIGKLELQARTGRMSPVPGGSDIGHVSGGSGTFGCLVRKNGMGDDVYLLGSTHVMALGGVAAEGDKILQPSVGGGGSETNNVVAILDDWAGLDRDDKGYSHLTEAAIAKPVVSVHSRVGDQGVPTGSALGIAIGMKVTICGAASGPLQAKVLDRNFRAKLTYSTPAGEFAVGFRDQVLCDAPTQGGDSGAVVLNRYNKVVGIHLAGTGSRAVFSRIDDALTALDLEIVTEDREFTIEDFDSVDELSDDQELIVPGNPSSEHQIDFQFISKLEGGCKLQGYVPDPTGSKSGVTIATGVDLGQMGESDLAKLNLPEGLQDRLRPYLRLKKQPALNKLDSRPLQVSKEEAIAIDEAVKSKFLTGLINQFNRTSQVAFKDLAPGAQTVITSVAFQYGSLKLKTPNFWSCVVAQDWRGTYDELIHFHDSYPTRRGKEADLLKSSLEEREEWQA